MNKSTTNDFDDAELIAYLDGKLGASRRQAIDDCLDKDTRLQSQLAQLDIDTLQIRESFDSVLVNTPEVNLPDVTPTQTQVEPEAETRLRYDLSRWAIAAGLLVCVATGWFARGAISPGQGIDNSWQVAVADYQVLYSRQTLEGGAPNATQIEQQLSRISDNSGLSITADMVQFPQLSFRRAQTLGVDGQPLIQMAFATDDGTPVALCFTRDKSASSEMIKKSLAGLNSTSWGNGEFGFIIIGDVSQKLLDQSAQLMASRLPKV